MIFIQFTGLSGAGKTTLANLVRYELIRQNYKVEIIDGDEYRKTICSDLGFSKEDRITNIRRLGFIGSLLAKNEIIVILSAINPYEDIRKEIEIQYNNTFTVWINCSNEKLIERDTKGLYKRALLCDGDPLKIYNLTGINDIYEVPVTPHLIINTHQESKEISRDKILAFIKLNIHVVSH